MLLFNKLLLTTFLCCAGLCVNWAQDAKTLVLKQLNEVGIDIGENDIEILQDVVSRISGVRHIHFQQLWDGVPILQTESGIHLDKKGVLLKVNDRLLSDVKYSRVSAAVISPENALQGVLDELGYTEYSSFTKLEDNNKKARELRFSQGDLFERDIEIQLRYTQWEGRLVPIWQVYLFAKDYQHYWDVWYHATESRVLQQNDLVVNCDYSGPEEVPNYNDNLFPLPKDSSHPIERPAFCENCYEVFALPVESPLHGNRSLSENAFSEEASPFGWHDFDGLDGHDTEVTDGNNVLAFEAGDNFGYQPAGGDHLDFSGFPFSILYDEDTEQYEDAAITNVFYVCNSAHDIFYNYGFDEASGNFQLNNYGRGGKEDDPLEVQVQRFIQPCNASMVTPPTDGSGPTMLLNTCNTRDGSYDNLVIVHEYAHGVTNRMTLGLGNLIYEESPSEGWSDWYGLMLTMQQEHTSLTPRTIGTYLREQSPNGSGVRDYPYIIDTALNPLTFDSLNEEMGIHDVGTVWATVLWELTWKLIDEFGFDSDIYNFTGDIEQDAGNIMALAIVTEGLRFTGSISGFVGARDGILAAAESIYGPGILCLVWDAFTTRGLGVDADSGDKIFVGDEVASFDFSAIEPGFDLSLEGICESSAPIAFLTGGFPRGGVYSGPGVRDNGNGFNFSFDPSLAGPGTHQIFYSMDTTPCFDAFQLGVEIEVAVDTEPPFMECPEDITIKYTSFSGYELIDFMQDMFIADNCSETQVLRTQNPIPGTMLAEGSVMITLEAEDLIGNVSQCEFLLTLIKVSDIGNNELGVIPIPANDIISIENPTGFLLRSYEIYSALGRKVGEGIIDKDDTATPVSIEFLSVGMYFLKVYYADTSMVLKILKD